MINLGRFTKVEESGNFPELVSICIYFYKPLRSEISTGGKVKI